MPQTKESDYEPYGNLGALFLFLKRLDFDTLEEEAEEEYYNEIQEKAENLRELLAGYT